ncbi:MAG: hypothetical protein AAFY88_26125, partial [Acidobacteriota bacterium]
VPETTRVAMTLLAGAFQAMAPGAVLLGALWVLQARPPTVVETLWILGGTTVLAWLATVLAAVLVRAGAASTGWHLVFLAVAGLCVFGPVPALRYALLPWGLAGSAVHAGLGGGGGVLGPLASAAVTTAAVAWVHLRWRRRDLERIQPSAMTSRPWIKRLRVPAVLEGRFGHWWPGPLRSLVRRDLLLVWRRSGPAAHLTVTLAVMWTVVAAGLAVDRSLPLEAVWRLRLMVGASTFAVLATVAVVPFLLHRQLPVFWLEKATGVALEQVWLAKVWLSGLLALPGLGSGALLIVALGPGTPIERLVAVAQLSATSLVISALFGLACFEIATEPLIGTLWSSMVAVSLASLFVLYPQGWWLWFLAVGWAGGELGKRASRRVKLTEVAT